MRNHELFSVKTIPGEYKRLFGRDVDLFEVIELLPIVLRQTHAVPPEYIFISTKVKDFKVITPCLYYSIRYVATQGYSPWRNNLDYIIENYQGTLINNTLDYWRESVQEANGDLMINQTSGTAVKVNEGFPKKPNGTYIDYQARGNVITLPVDNINVDILLTVMPVDSDGYPKVTEQVITAMAYFMNMVWVQKKYYAQQMPKYIFDDAKKDYDLHVGQASTPQSISDNELNDIMNALCSFNRHTVNNPISF